MGQMADVLPKIQEFGQSTIGKVVLGGISGGGGALASQQPVQGISNSPITQPDQPQVDLVPSFLDLIWKKGRERHPWDERLPNGDNPLFLGF